MSRLRLVVFDVDGTLADSQAEIVSAMNAAFAAESRDTPDLKSILSIVGLSLDQAMARLSNDLPEATRARLVAGYKDAYSKQRRANGASPLYPGVLGVLQKMESDPFLLMGLATGKSKRGLDALIDAHGIGRFFVTRQVADFHPSKPHPSMLVAALGEAGVAPRDAVMVGDTSYDMDMARAACVGALGVGWGYHASGSLVADHLVHDMAELPSAVANVLERRGENRS